MAKKIVLNESAMIYKNTHNLMVHFMDLAKSNHEDIIKLLDLLEYTNNDCKKVQQQKNEMEILIESLTRENENLSAELQLNQIKHRESEAKIGSLLATIHALKTEINEYKRRFNSVKMILKENYGKFGIADKLLELPFLNAEDEKIRLFDDDENLGNSNPSNISRNSQETQDSIDYDKTGESEAIDYNRTSRHRSKPIKNSHQTIHPIKRRSTSQPRHMISKKFLIIEKENCPTPVKRPQNEDLATTNKIITSNLKTPSKAIVPIIEVKNSLKRSSSESNLLRIEEKPMESLKTPIQANNNNNNKNCLTILNTMRSPMANGLIEENWTKGDPIDKCQHNYNISHAVFGSCYVCLKGLKLKFLKCQTCKIVLHEGCKANAPLPCIPYVETPQKLKQQNNQQKQQQQRPRLADFCPNSRPKIPAIIIRCVIAIENNYLNTIGLYRISGSEKEIKKLYEDLRSRYAPKLENRYPEVITGCIKKFLRDLREPLIPTSSYNEFVSAVEKNNPQLLIAAINDLPIPNRDTLAYLCLHWKKIATNENSNQMTLENLTTCLAPTIVGYSSKFGGIQANNNIGKANQQQSEESQRQKQVLLGLLKLDTDYWMKILDNSANISTSTPKTIISKISKIDLSKINEFEANLNSIGPSTTSSLIQPIFQSYTQRITPLSSFSKAPY